jgi:hypothetical protein
MGRFASGRHAYGISDRSGFRYKLVDMKKEWNGLLVGKDEFERKHPQLIPRRVISDAEALRDPRPVTKLEEERSIQFGFNPVGFTDPLNLITSKLTAIGAVGSVSIAGAITSSDESTSDESTSEETSSVNLTMGSVAGSVGSVTISTTGTSLAATYTVTVASYYGSNYFYIDGSRAATLSLSEGSTYKFDQSDSSNSGHPLRFSTTSNGTHGSGSEYTTGVTTNGTPGSSGAYTQIEVASGAPTLYYYCTNHSGMGGQINT